MQVSAAIAAFEGAAAVGQQERSAEAADRAAPVDGAVPRDRVTLSREARAKAEGAKDAAAWQGTARKLTSEQQRQVAFMQRTDARVRQHEAAHQAAGGSLTGGATFSYQHGPDGRSYAVGGEVPVRLQPGRTPDETIANARQARRAALAPSNPSPQNLAVAAQATEMEQAAESRRSRLAVRAYGKQVSSRAGADRAQEASTAGFQGAAASDAEEPVQAVRAAA